MRESERERCESEHETNDANACRTLSVCVALSPRLCLPVLFPYHDCGDRFEEFDSMMF